MPSRSRSACGGSQYHHWITDPGAARELAHRPGRLTGLGIVPQQFPKWTVEALDDALARGLRGIEIATQASDPDGGPPIELSDRRYDELWARAAELGAVIFVHPWGCTLDERLARWYLANSVEHAVALSHLIVRGVLERFRADHAWHAWFTSRPRCDGSSTCSVRNTSCSAPTSRSTWACPTPLSGCTLPASAARSSRPSRAATPPASGSPPQGNQQLGRPHDNLDRDTGRDPAALVVA
nr:amidohydrolase family protein [Amycolatopsis pithecellobii]